MTPFVVLTVGCVDRAADTAGETGDTRDSIDEDVWTRIVGDGFGDPEQDTVPEMEVFGGSLYVATSPTTQGLATLHRSTTGDVDSWSPVTAFDPPLQADRSIHSFGVTDLGGGVMWLGTGNEVWEVLTDDAFGKGAAVNELRSLRVSFGQLWLTAYTEVELSAGTPIWRTADGVTFVQANEDGFGDPDNNGQNAVTIGFGDHQYFGGPNYEAGGQVWRSLRQN
jgi:hypothetical protein